MPTIRVLLSVPKPLVAEVLQAIRDLEQRHPGDIGVSLVVDAATDFSAEELRSILAGIAPGLPYQRIIRTSDGRREVVDP